MSKKEILIDYLEKYLQEIKNKSDLFASPLHVFLRDEITDDDVKNGIVAELEKISGRYSPYLEDQKARGFYTEEQLISEVKKVLDKLMDMK